MQTNVHTIFEQREQYYYKTNANVNNICNIYGSRMIHLQKFHPPENLPREHSPQGYFTQMKVHPKENATLRIFTPCGIFSPNDTQKNMHLTIL